MNNRNKLTDEEIQQIMDTKTSSTKKSEIRIINEDAELYDTLMYNLDLEPSIDIPDKFVEKTTILAFRRKIVREIMWKAIIFISVSVPLITISLSVVYFMGQNMFWDFIHILESEGKYILFAIIGLISIQVLDKTLVQDKFRQFQGN